MIKLIKRLYQAFNYSLAGLKAAIEHEAAFRIEIFAAAFAVPLAFFWGHTAFEKAVLLATILLVFIVELLNSAIEAVVDRIGSEHHELSGRAKDMGSAAVLMTLFLVVIVWVGVLWGNW